MEIDETNEYAIGLYPTFSLCKKKRVLNQFISWSFENHYERVAFFRVCRN